MKHISTLFILALVSACSNSQQTGDDKQQNLLADETQQVAISVAQENQFDLEIVSNGKVAAGKFADLYWNVEGVISSISTANGKHVSQGQTIAQIDAIKLRNSLESATASLEQSRLQMQDVIIGQGLNPDTDQIPENVMRLAQVKSGFLQAQANYNSAKYDYESATLKAPISGVVANLSDRESNFSQRGKPFCRIIDQNSLSVDFSILESEIAFAKVGEKVDITVFSVPDRTWSGRISEINPFVESSGMVKARASIDRPDGLCEGMNISLKIRKNAGKFISVPKSAVVYRSSRPVVFTAKGGYANWHYVELGVENSENVAITSGLQPGDSVIISGNTFLADHTAIKY